MKKLALILAMVCFVMVLGAAQEFKPTVAVSGNASATLGFNLDSSVLALKNSTSTDITFTFVPQATQEKVEKEGTYGYIKLKDFKLTFDSDDIKTFFAASTSGGSPTTSITTGGFTVNEPTITAKLVSGPIFVQIYDEGATKDFTSFGFTLPNLSNDVFLNSFTNTASVTVAGQSYVYGGYTTDPFSLTLKVGNGNDWCKDAKGATAIWDIKPEVTVKVADATIKAGLLYTTVANTNVGLGASVAYTLKLNDTISVVPSVGVDVELASNLDWVVGGGVFAKWGAVDKYKPYIGVAADTGCLAGNVFSISGDDKEFQGGVGAAVQYTQAGSLNLVAQVVDQRGDAGLVPGLGAAASVEIVGLNKTASTMAGAFVNYAMGTVTPYVRLVYGKLVANKSISFGAGVEIAKVLPNVTLFADYNSLDLAAATNNMGLVSGGIKISY